MADKLDKYDPGWRQWGGSLDYLDWFDGSTWRLTPGEDFTVNVKTMRTYLYRKADEHGYRLHTRYRDGYLYIQALAPDGSVLGRLDEYGLPVSPPNP